VSGQYLDVTYPLPPPPFNARGGCEGVGAGGGFVGWGEGASEILKTELKSGKRQKKSQYTVTLKG